MNKIESYLIFNLLQWVHGPQNVLGIIQVIIIGVRMHRTHSRHLRMHRMHRTHVRRVRMHRRQVV